MLKKQVKTFVFISSGKQVKMFFFFFFFLFGFSFTTIHESQDCRGRGRVFLNSSLPLPPASPALQILTGRLLETAHLCTQVAAGFQLETFDFRAQVTNQFLIEFLMHVQHFRENMDQGCQRPKLSNILAWTNKIQRLLSLGFLLPSA